MTRSDQHRMIQDLKYHSASMKREDLYTFEMLLKRDRDDEELDVMSEQKLLQLWERYMPKKSKKDAEDLWKKLTSQGGKAERL